MRSESKIKEMKKVYAEKLEVLNKFVQVANDVIAGKSETQACKDAGLDLMSFRRFMKNNCAVHPSVESHVPEDCKGAFVSWEDLFLRDLYRRPVNHLSDFNECYEAVTSVLTEKEKAVIELKYRYDESLEGISERLNLSRERIRQITQIALRKMRRFHNKSLLYGKEYEVYESEINKLKIERENKIREMKAKIKELKSDITEEELENFNVNLEDMGLSVRAYNCLHRAGYKTLDEIKKLTENDLSQVRSLGFKSRNEILDTLKTKYGISLTP